MLITITDDRADNDVLVLINDVLVPITICDRADNDMIVSVCPRLPWISSYVCMYYQTPA